MYFPYCKLPSVILIRPGSKRKISIGFFVAIVVATGVVFSVLSAVVVVLVCRRRKSDPAGDLICTFTHHFVFL